MANKEATFTIPLRKEVLKGSIFKKTNKAVSGVRKFIEKHMKSENVKIGKELNDELWKNGIRNPPTKVKVTALKTEDGKVIVEKFGVKIEVDKPKKKKVEGDTPMDKIKQALEEKKEEKAAKKTEEKPAAEVKAKPAPVKKVTPKPAEPKRAEVKPAVEVKKPAEKKDLKPKVTEEKPKKEVQ